MKPKNRARATARIDVRLVTGVWCPWLVRPDDVGGSVTAAAVATTHYCTVDHAGISDFSPADVGHWSLSPPPGTTNVCTTTPRPPPTGLFRFSSYHPSRLDNMNYNRRHTGTEFTGPTGLTASVTNYCQSDGTRRRRTGRVRRGPFLGRCDSLSRVIFMNYLANIEIIVNVL